MKRINYLKPAFIGIMLISLAWNGYSQKCTKFINYQTKSIDTKGINMQIGGQPIGLGATNITTLQREASDKLQKFDLLQYNICDQLKNIKNDFIREKLQAQYSNLLMKMMNLLKVSENETAATTTTANAVETIVDFLESDNDVVEANNPIPTKSKEVIVADTPPATTANPPTTAVYTDDDIEVDISFPCGDFSLSSAGIIRAFGMESSMDAQVAKRIARTVALEELASKIEITVKTVAQDYTLRTQKNLTEELEKRFENMTQTSVNRTLTGYTTACEKFTQNKSTKKYSCYIALEISEENVLKPLYQELKKDETLNTALPNYEKFKETFSEVMDTYEKSF